MGENPRVPVFSTTDDQAKQLKPLPFGSEKELQTFVEANLVELLNVRLVASEFATGVEHGGRIDTLGLDEDGNPVIIEFKGDASSSVVNQGLFYRAWLLDHRGDFELAAQKQLGTGIEVTWQEPRLILVASSYTKYDTYAVGQLGVSVQLLRYQRYEDGTFVLDAVNEPLTTKTKKAALPKSEVGREVSSTASTTTTRRRANQCGAFLELRDQLLALEGVEEHANQKSQITYRTTKSFAALDFQKTQARCQFKGGAAIDDPENRARDITSYQWGYTWLAPLQSAEDVPYVFRLLKAAYELEK